MKLLTPEESMETCVRCGRCRDVCPTLDITGREADGPRGRVLMARSLLRGEISADDEIEDQMNRCLLCSACEDVCPVDVQVPSIVMAARNNIQQAKEEKKEDSASVKRFKNVIFDQLLPHKKRLKLAGDIFWLYQNSGIQTAVRKTKIMNLFPESLQQMEQALPAVSSPAERKSLPAISPAEHKKEKQPQSPKVAFFHGCIMDVMYRNTNKNSIELLNLAGFDVVTPAQQTCCGALAHHSGKTETTIELAKRNIEVFENTDADYVISNAGGCGAMLLEYEELFRDDNEWLERAKNFSSKIRDVSEAVLEKGDLPEFTGSGERVTYQPSCHLQYVMNVKDAPVKILKNIDGIEYQPLPDSKLCCGSAGIYNMLQPELANDILDKKMDNVKKTEANIILTSNPGCQLQISSGIMKKGLEEQVQSMHIVDFLIDRLKKTETGTEEENVKG